MTGNELASLTSELDKTRQEGTRATSPSDADGGPVDLRSLLRNCATSVAVVTTRDQTGKPWGVTIGSFGSLSLSPPLILWALRCDSRSHPVFQAARYFAVNVLSEGQEEISRRFASADLDRFGGIRVEDGSYGLPTIDGCVVNLECEQTSLFPGGDHTILVGLVRQARGSQRDPLIFCGGGYLKRSGPI